MMARRSLPPLSPEDRALWEALKKQIRPLHVEPPKPQIRDLETRPERAAKRPSKPPQEASELVWQAPGQFARALASSGGRKAPNDLREGGSQGLDRAKADRLRRGKMTIEGRLDLHGLTQDQAKAQLEKFIHASAKAGKRNLLIITGKGLSSGGHGVLRTRVPEWLGQGDLGRQVLAFSYAQKRDGEQGALYVLLRKTRG